MSPTSVTANAEMTRLLESGLPRCSFITADGFSTAGTSRFVVMLKDLSDPWLRSRQSGPYQRWGGNMLFTRDLAADIE